MFCCLLMLFADWFLKSLSANSSTFEVNPGLPPLLSYTLCLHPVGQLPDPWKHWEFLSPDLHFGLDGCQIKWASVHKALGPISPFFCLGFARSRRYQFRVGTHTRRKDDLSYAFAFQESGYALENSWPSLSCLFSSRPLCKNLPSGPPTMRSWAWSTERASPSPQSATDSVQSLGPDVGSRRAGRGERKAKSGAPLKALAPTQKGGDEMERDSKGQP